MALGLYLQKIDPSQRVLREARVKLEHSLHIIVSARVNIQRFGADEPRNSLGARWGSERASVSN